MRRDRGAGTVIYLPGQVVMKILLHMCCSTCSLYPVKLLLAEDHRVTGFWYNPNVHPRKEYNARRDSLKKLAGDGKLDVLYQEEYAPEDYFEIFNMSEPAGSGDVSIPPAPARCASCYQLRLEKTARQAQEHDYDAFSTTLLISPYQDFGQIVSTGKALAEQYNVLFHVNDYRPHFRDAQVLSKELGLYRQKYCGCIFSKEERKTGKNIKCQSTNEKR